MKKTHKKERHKRKTSTNVRLQNDCCNSTSDQNQAPATFWMAEMVAEAHFARTIPGASLGPKLLSLRILHLIFMIGVLSRIQCHLKHAK